MSHKTCLLPIEAVSSLNSVQKLRQNGGILVQVPAVTNVIN